MSAPAAPTHLAKKAPEDDAYSFYLFRMLQSLRQSIRAIDMHSTVLVQQHNISGPQLVCLKELAADDDVATAELARRVHLSPTTVKDIVGRLRDKGLLEAVEENGQVVRLTMTNKGHQLLKDAPIPIQDVLANGFAKLPEGEQETIVQSLERVVDLLDARNVDAAPMLETGPLTMAPEVKQAFWQSVPVSAAGVAPGNTLDIRPAREEDKPLLMQFINSSTEWYRNLVTEDDLAEHEVDMEWADINFKRREFYIGYDENNTPVGTISLQFFGDYAYLGYIYVDTSHVGKAYGKQLMDFAKAECKTRGAKGMVLIAHPKATWAIKAYQKYGFDLVYRDKADILAWNDGALKPYYEDFFMLFLYDFAKRD